MLVIPMKTVLELGEGRFQLRCMCGRDFTFAPKEKLNAVGEKAECPGCKAQWDGSGDVVNPHLRFFSLSGSLKGEEMVEGDVTKVELIGVGNGYDILHFATHMISKLDSLDNIRSLMIVEIDSNAFEKARDYLNKKNSVGRFVDLFSSLMSMMNKEEGE